MNNGVDNNQVVQPGVVPVSPAVAPAAQAGVQTTQTYSTTNNAVSGGVETIPAAVYSVPQTVPPTEPTTPETVPETTPQEEKTKKKSSLFNPVLLILLIAVGAYAYYLKTTTAQEIQQQKYICSPASETKEEVALDINSTLVKDLYQKVATNILEDYFQREWNDTMKVYLAYRQVPEYKIYESNCNLFSPGEMENYTCDESTNFKPRAFKLESIELEWKKLFGETTPMPRINANLKGGCIGGFEYIPAREEYVEGYCQNANTTTLKVKKELKEAVTSNNTIILKEEVTYMGTDKITIPDYLVSGTYYYTFRLDMNYNYILISKQYDQKYE